MTRNLLGYLWVLILAAALCFYGAIVYQKSAQVLEYPFGCDAYGYLSMAKKLREARSLSLPVFTPTDFTLEDEQTKKLAHLMQSEKLPLPSWSELVAPHAYHFFPLSEKVGPQYPPGTGWVLSLFPEGRAVKTINQLTCLCLIFFGVTALIYTAFRRTWISAGFVAVVAYWALEVLHQIGGGSFSINSMLLPLTLSVILAVYGKRSQLLLFLAGCFFGFGILVRIPILFLYPGVFLLTLTPDGHPAPGHLRRLLSWVLSPFNFGILLFGVVPLLFHQHFVTGAWYLPTYSAADNSLPELNVLKSNLSFYLGHGYGSGDNWLIFDLILGTIGLFTWAGGKAGIGLGAKRWVVATGVIWGVPMAYFLTHRVQIGYYPVPGTLATALSLVFGALWIESTAKLQEPKRPKTGHPFRRRVVGYLAFLPGLVALQHVWLMRHEWRQDSPPQIQTIQLTPELKDPKAWIWADMMTGTIRYYENKAAFKIGFSSPETRLLIYKHLFRQGEAQYFVQDSPVILSLMTEAQKLGAKLVERGKVGTYPYYRVDWPARF